jgi:hypothetical protein
MGVTPEAERSSRRRAAATPDASQPIAADAG